ncbi:MULTISPECIES: AMP-binding protein [unclassified Photorhabdus]|uniref:AMP-binding protein n=1 Tax=unclassified Photorhabdus TaxID=2620880 RepID=UPI000DCC8BCC|nr:MULTISPECIES: AMP-binding protein [unclassified Photorhabdus]RAW93239.1 hypothetical protein CKY03_22250 [Photorhabdus sp. S9-53]RAW93311.1 hypothetical protein CKY05_22185 [Photorhabdus sp. S10-54]RAW96798.1 hypothetical protein CKY04_22255 [Photorhabdus sp. S8-52]
MLTIDSLLQGSWYVNVKNQRYHPENVAEMTRNGVAQIVGHCTSHKTNSQALFVFLIRNNMEGMLCYFIASTLKLKALIINISDIAIVKMLIKEEYIAAYVMSHAYQVELPDGKRIGLIFDGNGPFPVSPITISEFTPFPYAYFYFMTSGTTSKPKLVQYQEIRLTANAHQVSLYLNLSARDNTLCFFPVQYMYGLSTMLSSLISQGGLVFEQYQLSSVSEIISYYGINTLPLIGDWMIPLSKVLVASRVRLNTILNASDRLLNIQASQMLTCCDVLWNNFGQTESGPRLFCQRLETVNDIEKRSRNSVVAPGFVMSDRIKIQLRKNSEDSTASS